MSIELIWNIWGIVAIAIILSIAIFATVVYIKRIYIEKTKILIATDIPYSMKNNTLYINCYNVDKYEELWKAHESDLRIYAVGMEIPSIFYKIPSITNGYKIAYSSSLTNQQVLAIIAATKYNKFELSSDEGLTRIKVHVKKDDEAHKIVNRIMRITEEIDYSRTRSNDIYNKIKSNIDNEFNEEVKDDDRVISQLNPYKAGKDRLRFEANISDGHSMHSKGFKPENTCFYYTYKGNLYPFEVEFVGRVNNMYKWDLRGDLEPGRAYVGFSWSIDKDTVIMPSTTFYGITRDENKEMVDLSDARLGKPVDKSKALPMWTKESAIDYMNKELIKKTCDIVIKKHYEEEFPDDYVSFHRINDFYREYKWIPFELDELI